MENTFEIRYHSLQGLDIVPREFISLSEALHHSNYGTQIKDNEDMPDCYAEICENDKNGNCINTTYYK